MTSEAEAIDEAREERRALLLGLLPVRPSMAFLQHPGLWFTRREFDEDLVAIGAVQTRSNGGADAICRMPTPAEHVEKTWRPVAPSSKCSRCERLPKYAGENVCQTCYPVVLAEKRSAEAAAKRAAVLQVVTLPPMRATDAFHCDKFRCTLSARTCVDRQDTRTLFNNGTTKVIRIPRHVQFCATQLDDGLTQCAQGRAIRAAIGAGVELTSEPLGPYRTRQKALPPDDVAVLEQNLDAGAPLREAAPLPLRQPRKKPAPVKPVHPLERVYAEVKLLEKHAPVLAAIRANPALHLVEPDPPAAPPAAPAQEPPMSKPETEEKTATKCSTCGKPTRSRNGVRLPDCAKCRLKAGVQNPTGPRTKAAPKARAARVATPEVAFADLPDVTTLPAAYLKQCVAEVRRRVADVDELRNALEG